MPEGEALPGRSGITALFTDCIRRPAGGAARDLPLVVLLGKRGSGKTRVLTYLRDACKGSVAIPYVFIDCATRQDRTVQQLIGALADILHAERWPEFGRLHFPRLTLGVMAAAHPPLPEDLKRAQEELRENLRGPLKQHVAMTVGLGADVLQAGHVPQFAINIFAGAARVFAGSSRAIDRLYQTGLQWYGARSGPSERSGLSVLVELHRQIHSDDQRELAERMLCEAFLDDLNDAYSRRRKFNCAIFLDNCDGAGIGFLNLLADLRAGRSGTRPSDPLVVVTASRTVPHLTRLDHGWTFPWEPDRPGAPRVPDPDEVDYEYWLDNRTARRKPESWWLPLHLRDLVPPELDPKHRRFIHRLTGGHPWSAREVLRAISTAPPDKQPEQDLRTVLERFAPRAEFLLADLPTSLRNNLVLWSAARDVDTAAGGGIGEGGRPAALKLYNELTKRLWLVPDNRLPGMMPRGPQLHPCLRRILLHKLAANPAATWSQVHLQLRNYATGRQRRLDAAYHDLARGELSLAIDYLADQFYQLDADSWIREFDAVTAAPSTRGAAESPADQYDALMLASAPPDREDRIRNTLWSMVAARWIWSDPLGDPMFMLKHTIADGYARLAEDAQTGFAKYHSQAQTYRDMKAW